jgi:glutamate dehydrogenase (NAD(P)+)
VSYFEWVQNQANQQWDIEEVNARLKKRMYKVVDTVFDRWQRFVVGEDIPSGNENIKKEQGQKPDFRSMALSLAIDRIAKATLMRGIWP